MSTTAVAAVCLTAATTLVAPQHVEARDLDQPDSTPPQRVIEVGAFDPADPDGQPLGLTPDQRRVGVSTSVTDVGRTTSFPNPPCPPPGGMCPDPHKVLRHGFSLVPGWGRGSLEVTSCVRRDSRVNGRHDLCRVIRGAHTSENWVINGCLPGQTRNCALILRSRGSNRSKHGHTITVRPVRRAGPIRTYEGCRWQSPTNNYWCDFLASKHVVLRGSGNHWDLVLRKAWRWSLNMGSTLGCAGGLASIWFGAGVVSWPFLTDCADGPL